MKIIQGQVDINNPLFMQSRAFECPLCYFETSGFSPCFIGP